MGRLVDQDPAAALQKNIFIIFAPLFSIKRRVVTRKTVDADPFSKRRLAEDKIP
jgi:hypothetical protein